MNSPFSMPSHDTRDETRPLEGELAASPRHVIQLEMLGPMQLRRDGEAVPLPSSRKVRGLLAYLALAPCAATRAHLCQLLWETPLDPRSELRWALSKLRGVLDEPDHPRVQADFQTVRLDLSNLQVDAMDVLRAVRNGLNTCSVAQLRALAARFRGVFLEGLIIERSAPFSAWLLTQRRSLRAARIAILERLAQLLPAGSDEAVANLETWLQLAPLDQRAHRLLLMTLAQHERFFEGEEHLATTIRLFEAEVQDWRPLGRLWHELRTQSPGRFAELR